MNLKQITERLAEIAAETLTLHNALATIMGENNPNRITCTSDVKVGDTLNFDRDTQTGLVDPIYHNDLKAGNYKAEAVETDDYAGDLTIRLERGWIDIAGILASGVIVTKVI